MDRGTGSLTGVYTNPVQAGEETDFWSRPLRSAEDTPSPIANPDQERQQQPVAGEQQPGQQPQDPSKTTPQQPVNDNSQELAQLQQRLAAMEAERQGEQRQRQWNEEQRKQRERRATHEKNALAAIDKRDDLDDDQKTALKGDIKTHFDNLNQTVDQEFTQYNSQVEGAFKNITGPMFIGQTLQNAGIATAKTFDRIAKFGITAETIQHALPELKRLAAEDHTSAQTQASDANMQQQAQGANTVSGYGTSAPTGAEPEKGSFEHLEQLLVGY